MSGDLKNAIKRMAYLPDSEKVNIKGKMYAQVATRVQVIREEFGSSIQLETAIHHIDDASVRVEARVLINDRGVWSLIGNGFAEEYRGAGMINKNSALENCETSAIGRALANCGLSGGEYASAFEVDNAINLKPDFRGNAPKSRAAKQSDKSQETNTPVAGDEVIDPVRLMNDVVKNLRDPETAECQAYFEKRKIEIYRARDIAEGALKTRYNKMIDIYGL